MDDAYPRLVCNPSWRTPRHEKTVNLALQGGGAHGAFTWGVLDRLFEDGRIWVSAISGASAGAMNAVVAASGFQEGGAEGARAKLAEFWRAVARAGAASPIRRSPLAVLMGDWSLAGSPSYIAFDLMSRLASPYDLNPYNLNPLRDVLSRVVDFDALASCSQMRVHVSATNVETGRVKVFSDGAITLDAVMASACLPFVFQAVEIEGEWFWDGGYMGNPPLFPAFNQSGADDIVIVQINPVLREGPPKRAQDILNRVNEITFNSALIHELRSIEMVNGLLRTGRLAGGRRYREKFIHIIEARKRMRPLDASSKLNAEWAFLRHLFEIGREAADRWIGAHYDCLGTRSSVDLRELVTGERVAREHAQRAAE